MSQKSILLRSFHLCTLYNPSVYRAQDPTSPIVQSAWLYSHIRYRVFVELDFFGGVNMGIRSKILLYSECFKLAGIRGLIACNAYISGRLTLDEIPVKSSENLEGAVYE